MNAKTLKALEGSIKKWEGIVARSIRDEGPDNCPLCQMFYIDGCYGCPVWKSSGHVQCMGTPIDAWAAYEHYDEKNEGLVINNQTLKLAQDELNFLRSLLPKKSCSTASKVRSPKTNEP